MNGYNSSSYIRQFYLDQAHYGHTHLDLTWSLLLLYIFFEFLVQYF